MKKEKIVFWVATGLFSIMMVNSAYQYLTSPDMEAAFNHLGFPEYFRIELAIAKFLGVLALLIPKVPKGFKQFAYAGFLITLISAAVAHISSGDGVLYALFPVIACALLIVSYIYYEKLNRLKK